MKTDFEKLSYAFALAIIGAYAELRKQKFFELSGQLIRSGQERMQRMSLLAEFIA